MAESRERFVAEVCGHGPVAHGSFVRLRHAAPTWGSVN